MLQWGAMTEPKCANLCIVLEKSSIKMVYTGYIGLYRDACFKNNNGHQSYKIRKELIKIFQTKGLNLEIKYNFKKVNYLDITFDLNTAGFELMTHDL